MKNLNKEINRIKSLFNESRLYGNLVKESDPGDLTPDLFGVDDELNEADPGDLTPDLIGPENESDLAIMTSGGDQENITESLGAAPSKLLSTYKHYDNMGSEATFDEIFQKLREEGKEPYSSWENGCATKVSLALQAAGKNVPAGFRVQDGPMAGTTIQTSASGLSKKLGTPDVSVSGEISKEELAEKFGNGTGVLICSPCGFGPGVSGHATVFHNGNTADGTDYHLNNPDAEIKMWYA